MGKASNLRSGHVILAPVVEQSPAANNPYNQADDYYPGDSYCPPEKDAPEHHPQYGKDTKRCQAPFKSLVAHTFSPPLILRFLNFLSAAGRKPTAAPR